MFIYSLCLYICLVFPMYFFNMYKIKVEKKSQNLHKKLENIIYSFYFFGAFFNLLALLFSSSSVCQCSYLRYWQIVF